MKLCFYISISSFSIRSVGIKKNTLQMNELGPKNCQICSFFREVQLSKFFFQNSMDYYEENDKFNNVF